MTRGYWTLGTAAILLAGCLVGLDAYRRLHDAGSSSRTAVLAAMPPDSSAVVFADFTDLRGAPFAAEFYNWIPKTQADADYTQFLRETGFVYERDLDRVAMAFIKSEKDSTHFALAVGRFDRQKIEAYAARSGSRENRGGREIFSVPLSDTTRKISFAFVSKGTIALTDTSDIAPFLAPVPNSADARNWREHFTRVAGSPVFAVIRQDSEAGSALASRAPGGFQSPQLSALLDQLQWITLAGKPQDNALRVVAEGECSSEQTTRQLADMLNGVLLMAQAGLNGPRTRQQLDPRIREAYLELLKGADVSRLDRGESKSVRVVFDVTPKILATATLVMPAAPTPAAAPAVPEHKRRSQKLAHKE
jgi:hypothetical protein